eukprot:Lankesteria_metandrocarpae@DN4817_c1_g1_i3.p1
MITNHLANVIQMWNQFLKDTRTRLPTRAQPFFTCWVCAVLFYSILRMAKSFSYRGHTGNLDRILKAVDKIADDAEWSATGWKRVYASLAHIRKSNDANSLALAKLLENK